jgi:hypothetical protein
MTETTLIEHERRLTRLEDRLAEAVPVLVARIAKLEEAAEQARVDREQAERGAAAELRRQLEVAEAERSRLAARNGL